MDIHRCRFVPYTPSAINALAFSSPADASNAQTRLAVGRENGNIEIWNPAQGDWIHETTLWGGRGRTIEGLAWTQELEDDLGHRLFSIGYNDAVVEWDLCTGQLKRQAHVSEVWCIAAQPAWSPTSKKRKRNAASEDQSTTSSDKPYSQIIAAGCGDGSIVLLSTEDDDLIMRRFLTRPAKKRVRVLSIAWQDRNTLVVGFADNVVRVYDVQTGHNLRTMSVGGTAKGAPKDNLVWAVECLRDGTIVSGDSTGTVTFWDGRTFSQLQKIKGHEADTLCLASSADGRFVFSGGMDRRTVTYSLEKANGSQYSRWTKLSHRRFHDHDVKVMASLQTSDMGVLVSGGKDTQLVLSPLEHFLSENHRRLPPVPQTIPVTGASRLVVSWLDNEVGVWQVNQRLDVQDQDLEGLDLEEDKSYKSVARLALQSEEHITSVSISADGRLLAIANTESIKLFGLNLHGNASRDAVKVEKLELPTSLSNQGARLAQFSPDKKWLLIVSPRNEVLVAKIVSDNSDQGSVLEQRVPLRRATRKSSNPTATDSWMLYRTTITRADFSADSRIVAISDLEGRVESWILEGHEDATAAPSDTIVHRRNSVSSEEADSDDDMDDDSSSEHTHQKLIVFGQHWVRNPLAHLLPRFTSPPIILSFQPQPLSLNEPQSHSVPNGNPGLHPTRSNPHAYSHTLPSTSAGLDTLLILTANHELYLFSVLTGHLTSWSRRNPPALLPNEFKLQSDRGMGCIWDHKGRAWLYGASWLAMFDPNCDLPRPAGMPRELLESDGAPRSSLNRDHLARLALKTKQGRHGGAGSLRTAVDQHDPLNTTLQAATNGHSNTIQQENGDSNQDATTRAVQLANTRRKEAATPRDVDGDDEMADDEPTTNGDTNLTTKQTTAAAAVKDKDKDKRKSAPFFLTSRYRPILGIVPLSASTKEKNGVVEQQEEPLEVALIERPAFDLELPPRFFGRQEWSK